MPTVAITDYSFDDLSIETPILTGKGLTVTSQKTGKDQAKLIELVKDADAVIAQFAPINAEVIASLRRAKVIVRYGIGVDNVDLKAAAAKGIPVSNIPDYCIDEVADHTLAAILDLVRRNTSNVLKVKNGGWGLAVPVTSIQSLKNLTVGVVAFGGIAREVVARVKAFKAKVLVYDPVVDPAVIIAAGAIPVTLDELYRTSDLITLHCPSLESTKYLINAQSIAKLKDGVLLVNTSRGTLIRTDDLVAALKSGKVAAAALDVTDPEPPPADHPLLKLDNVFITAHIASYSPQAVWRLRSQAAESAAVVLTGGKAVNVVNGIKG